MVKYTTDEIAAKLWTVRIKLRGLAHLLQSYKLDAVPLDIEEASFGIGEILNAAVEELDDLRNEFDCPIRISQTRNRKDGPKNGR